MAQTFQGDENGQRSDLPDNAGESPMDYQITGGKIIDPGHFEGAGDVHVVDGKIAGVVPAGSPPPAGKTSKIPRPDLRIIDARGKIVSPGLIDLHVHLREPGFEHKETIATGCRAAVCGGFSAVCCMANTRPVNDDAGVTELILERAAQAGLARVYPVAAVTRGLEGRVLCDFESLKAAGAAALSDDGRPLVDSRLMRLAMEKAAQLNLPVISHSEDPYLVEGGVMNEGPVARGLGVAGIPNAAESIMVLREIALSELTGAPVHIAHVSTRESVRAIRAAKDRGVPVTAETAPHYFTLTDEAVRRLGADAKMNPPLRSEADRLAIRRGLADGTIDCIATDHAPHAPEEKGAGLEKAPNGIIGLETAVSVSLSLVEEGILSLTGLIAKMASIPARILGIPCGLRVGMPADITLIDPNLEYTIEPSLFRSRSRNSPFVGMKAKGKPVMTMVAGRIVFEDLL
jgi:dihydroorotase